MYLLLVALYLLEFCVAMGGSRYANTSESSTGLLSVHVYHFIDYEHGNQLRGRETCQSRSQSIDCNWYSNESARSLRKTMKLTARSNFTVALYNIHTLWEKTKKFHPLSNMLSATLTMVESQESYGGYGARLFNPSFHQFDGVSTTHPSSHVQRIYDEAYVTEDMLLPVLLHKDMIKGGTFVSSHCLPTHKKNSRRDDYVISLRNNGIRVDGLGKCLSTPGIKLLPYSGDTPKDAIVKQQVIKNYMFHLAFENQIEEGYVTEKVFDALIAGTVPIYLGDSQTCKKLLPDPLAAIFLSDFNYDMKNVSNYLKLLMNDEIAYERHRMWRQSYNSSMHVATHDMMKQSWHCRVCSWAVNKVNESNNHTKSSKD